ETVALSVHHEKSTGPPSEILIQSDGTFKVGSGMPAGKWTAALVRTKGSLGARGGSQQRYRIPGGFTIEEGKTEYEIELGPNWRPEQKGPATVREGLYLPLPDGRGSEGRLERRQSSGCQTLFGNALRETLFRMPHTSVGCFARNRVSQNRFPNRVWEPA